MTTTLSGKVALVTGASRGIGAAIAKRLAAEGAAVAITYVNGKAKADEVVESIKSSGGKAVALQADSGDPAAIKSAVDQTAETLKRLDIIVNNAGIAVLKPIDQFAIEDFDRMVAINIRGVFAGAQAAARYMDKGGRIITIGSTNADRMPFVGGSVYAMTKAAVAGLTRGLARDLGPRGITVNAIQPGPVDTDLNPAEGEFAGMIKGLTALGRYAHVSEVAGFTAYLASDEAGYITGACLTIDGGFAA